MILVPLGVSSATPTANRHMPAFALWREGRIFLFDCGENAQMQMLKVGMKRSKIDHIFISHLDGDHLYGLPGLISTMHIQRREKPLTLVGPIGLKDFVEYHISFAHINLTFDIHYVELEDGFDGGVVVDEEEFEVHAKPLQHNVLCLGYRFQEKDKPGKVDADKAVELGITEDDDFKALKAGNDITLADGTVITAEEIVGPVRKGNVITYITDTRVCPEAVELAKDATFLVHEATFGTALTDKAVETMHATAVEAATVAKEANVDRLIITHYSARYTNEFVLFKEAKEIFDNTWVANELRPVMTDPAVEAGIFMPPRENQGDSRPPRDNRGRHGGNDRRGGYQNNRGGGNRRGGYDNRRNDNRRYDNRGGGGGGYNRDRDRRGGYDNNRGYDNRGGGDYRRNDNRRYDNRGGSGDYNRDRGGSSDYNRDRGGRSYDDRRSYDNSDRSYDRRVESRIDRPKRNDYDRDRNSSYRDKPDSRYDRERDQDKKDVIKPRNNFDDYDRF